MLVRGKFQAIKLTKKEKDGKVYRTLWIKDESDDDLQVSFDVGILPMLRQNGVYEGLFSFKQYQKYNGYGVEDKIVLLDIVELKDEWNVSGEWSV